MYSGKRSQITLYGSNSLYWDDIRYEAKFQIRICSKYTTLKPGAYVPDHCGQ